MSLELRNPHSILAAIQQRPRDVHEIVFRSGTPTGIWEEVALAAQQAGIAVSLDARGSKPQRRGDHNTERAGGVTARVRERSPVPLESLLPKEDSGPEPPGLWLALDCLQDPQNVGAIFRSAAFFGVRGILTTKDRACPINSTVYDVAAGGLESVPHAVVTNLSQAFEKCQAAGLWVLGTSEHANRDVSEVDRERNWILVIGNEAKGLRRLTLERCDETCRLTPKGGVGSLNASVAAGVFLAILTSGGMARPENS